ncbi:hypothetical protein D3C73_946040 [compost metagenome]
MHFNPSAVQLHQLLGNAEAQTELMIDFFGIRSIRIIGVKNRSQTLRRNPLSGIRHDDGHILFFNLGTECYHTFMGMVHGICQQIEQNLRQTFLVRLQQRQRLRQLQPELQAPPCGYVAGNLHDRGSNHTQVHCLPLQKQIPVVQLGEIRHVVD